MNGGKFTKATVKNISLSNNKRLIAISDIHGNLNFFQKLLEEISYTPNYILILVGDLIG